MTATPDRHALIPVGPTAPLSGPTAAVCAAAIVAVTLLVFMPTLRNGFLPLGFDDALITDTEAIRALTWPNLWSLWTQFNHAHYVPLTMLSFALDYRLWGLEPFGYHLTNVLLHALSALLVAVFLWRIVAPPVATVAAVVFAAHPVQMEAVSVAVQRKTLLSGVFFFLALIAYQQWCARRQRSAYVLAVLACTAAALAKPSVVTVPLVLLLYDYVFVGGRLRWLDKLPFLVIGAVITAAALAAHAAVGALQPLHGGNLLAHALMVSRILFEYAGALLVPLGLSPIYYYPRAVVYSAPNFIAVALVPLVCVYLVRRRREYPWAFFGLGWFLLVLLPESNLIPLAQLRADRFLYLPLVGFALWVAVAFDRAMRARPASAGWRLRPQVLAAALVAVYAWLCAGSAGWWRDDISAWTRVVQRHQWCAVAHGMLGRAYYEQRAYAAAEHELTAATRLQSPLADPHLYLAKVYAEQGQGDLATAQVERFLELAPGNPEGLELLAALQKGNGS